MGLVAESLDAFGGVLGGHWKDFYTVPDDLRPTSVVFGAVRQGVGAHPNGLTGGISNGSRIVVPEGYALILVEEGEITGGTTLAGAYEWFSVSPDSPTDFAGDGIGESLFKKSLERFGLSARPQSLQQAFFVSLTEQPNNRFGTVGEIYWDDAYLNAQVGASARGTYTLRITDPVLFLKTWVPATYLQPGAVFDFTDPNNPYATQLFNEVVGCLAEALSLHSNDPEQANRMTGMQQDAVGFGERLSSAVERSHRWKTRRGIEIVSATVLGLEYDAPSRELLATVQRADALLGARGDSNLQASVAAGFESMGDDGRAERLFGLTAAAGSADIFGLQQQGDGTQVTTNETTTPGDDPVATLTMFKQLLDTGLISAADYDAAKAKVLGI